MATKRDTDRNHAIITALVAQYPNTFSFDPKEIRPLKEDIIKDIAINLQIHGDDFKHLRRAIIYYENWPSYLRAVALGKRRRDLRGHRISRIPYKERLEAKKKLQYLGLWTENLEDRYVRCLCVIDLQE